MDHFRNPRNKKRLDNPDVTSGENNPSCGDKIVVDCNIENGVIKEIGFHGSGCVISQASASMLFEFCIGKTIEQVLNLGKDVVLELIGIELGPNRLRCALLALQALQSGLLSNK